jgi:hypothetical protein
MKEVGFILAVVIGLDSFLSPPEWRDFHRTSLLNENELSERAMHRNVGADRFPGWLYEGRLAAAPTQGAQPVWIRFDVVDPTIRPDPPPGSFEPRKHREVPSDDEMGEAARYRFQAPEPFFDIRETQTPSTLTTVDDRPLGQGSVTHFDRFGKFVSVYCVKWDAPINRGVVERVAIQTAMTGEWVGFVELPQVLVEEQRRRFVEGTFPKCSYLSKEIDSTGQLRLRLPTRDMSPLDTAWQAPESVCKRDDVDYVERYRNGPGKEVRRPGSGICDVDQSLVPLYEALNPHYLAWLRGALDG